MYKLLIVDDENQIREGLKRILNWTDFDIEICGEASDGNMALQLMEEKKPHIVLTDIKMPGMDGIRLLEETRKRGFLSKMIVLSGYDDFELVRQAMRYGAVDYLLKPAGKNELIQVIEELLDQLADVGEEQESIDKNLEMARDHLLNRIITNSISLLEMNEKIELLDIHFGSEAMAVARLEFSETRHTNENMFYHMPEVLSFCRRYFEEKHLGIVFCNTGGRIVLILTDINAKDSMTVCKSVMEDLIKQLKNQLQVDMYVAVSRPIRAVRNIKTAYEEAEDTLKYKFIFESGTVLLNEEIGTFLIENEASDFIINPESIERMIQSDDYEEIYEFLNTLLDEERIKRCNINYYVLKNIGMEIIIYLYHFLLSNSMIERRSMMEQKENALRQLMETKNLNEMHTLLQELLTDSSQRYKQNTMKQYSKIVADALLQIQENHQDINLSLQYLADRFGVNTAYLGRIFKKETGNSFVDYLNLYRIEEAKRLLKETNLKGSELCKRVGFSNYNYFYIVFKKITGQKPTEIRNNE